MGQGFAFVDELPQITTDTQIGDGGGKWQGAGGVVADGAPDQKPASMEGDFVGPGFDQCVFGIVGLAASLIIQAVVVPAFKEFRQDDIA